MYVYIHIIMYIYTQELKLANARGPHGVWSFSKFGHCVACETKIPTGILGRDYYKHVLFSILRRNFGLEKLLMGSLCKIWNSKQRIDP